MSLLDITDLTVTYSTDSGTVHAVNDVSFSIDEGVNYGLAGESGSGKSVTARSILGLVDDPGRIESGSIRFRGEELVDAWDDHRGDIAIVFQDPGSALNPVYTVGNQIREALRIHQGLRGSEARERAVELLEAVGIPDPSRRVSEYPHQLSGGMQQRAVIATALACDPDLLVCDEPTTALDVTIEAQIFELIDQLRRDHDMGTILITHDLSVVAHACDRVLIMYAGRVVEEAPTPTLYARPLHPYTLGLLDSIPAGHQTPRTRLPSIPGEVPDLAHLPGGCSFAPRCRFATDACRREDPALRRFDPDHRAACLRLEEIHDRAAG